MNIISSYALKRTIPYAKTHMHNSISSASIRFTKTTQLVILRSA